MMTGDPPATSARAYTPRPRVWPWAAGSILIPLVIITATVVGARYAARARLAAQVAPGPALPPLRVASALQLESGFAQWTLAPGSSGPVAVVFPSAEPTACLPGTACANPALANHVTLYTPPFGDLRSGPPFAIQVMPPTDLSQCATLTGATLPDAYLACPGRVLRIPLDGASVTQAFVLPAGLEAAHSALDAGTRTLYTASGATLYAFDLTHGTMTSQQTLNGLISTPFVDSRLGQIFVVVNGGSSQPTLWAFRTRTLKPVGAAKLPLGWSAGPGDSGAGRLYGFERDGAVSAVDLSAPALSPAFPYPAVAATSLPALSGARALGWDETERVLVALYADHVTAYDAGSLRAYATSPVAGAWDPQLPLAVDGDHGVAYVPDASGAIVALSLAHPGGFAAPDAATAVIMARAGLGKLLPDTNQTPPFLDAATFPAIVANVQRVYAIHYSDLGWRGPYNGSAAIILDSMGKQPGDYFFSFAIEWDQLFLHTHTWTVELLPDGHVRMLSDTGDAIP